MADSKRSSQPLNSLRLGMRELNVLADKLNPEGANPSHAKREYVRYPYRKLLVLFEVTQPGGNVLKIPVVSLNLSASGISILHSAFMHSGLPCMITMPHPYLSWIQVRGEVIRCSHRGGRVHEIGIRFDEMIATREMLELDLMNEAYTMERIDPERLTGKLLVLDDSDLEHHLIRKLLDGTNLEVATALKIDEAVELAGEGFDLCLVDYHLDGESGAEFVKALAEHGVDTPVITMTSDNSPQVREEMRAAGAIGFVGKPLVKERVLQALAEFMLTDGNGGPIFTTLSEEHGTFELAEQFVDRTDDIATDLHAAIQADEYDTCLSLSRNLIGQAAPLGYAELGLIAEACIKKLTATMSVRESGVELRHLISAIKRVRRRSAA